VDEVPTSPWPTGCTLVVLTGGSSRRLGRDKATTHVGGRRLIDRLLAGVPAELPVVIAGPILGDVAGRVVFVREDPRGSGPLAAIGAGLAAVRTPLVGVIAADMPFALPILAEALTRLADAGSVGAGGGVDAIVPVDPTGRRQLLCAAYRTEALRAVLAALGPLVDLPVRALQPGLAVMEWPVSAAALADVDTREQLGAARSRASAEEDRDMQEWIDAVRQALGVDVTLDIDAILDVARDAAHTVDRPAAPVTAYLLGAAVAAGADPAQAAAVVSDLARGWGAPEQ
jgi:molybdopterin-guanine dinucleotide biosynthesis protein A